MSWINRSVFVTGATGFLGIYLVDELVRAGAKVVALVRDELPTFRRLVVANDCTVVRGDVCDAQLIGRILAEYEVQTVFHLAAQAIVPIANRPNGPMPTFETNVRGTWCVLEACRNHPLLRAVVLASSDKAYGPSDDLPYTEDTPLRAEFPYDVSKACADMIAQSYASTFDLPVAITRCGNLFGFGDNNPSRIVPATIRSVLNKQRPIIRSNGFFVRDYFHVNDAAKAYMLLAGKLADGSIDSGLAFNFSYEKPMSVFALVRTIVEMMKSDLEPIVESQPDTRFEIAEQSLSAQRARDMLNWKPALGFEERLRQTISQEEGAMFGDEDPGGEP